MPLEQALEALGLREKEAKVYLSLLKLGRGSAQAIAADSGLKRPTVYVILDELATQGIVHEIPKATKKLYRPLSPSLLLERVERKVRMARQALPEIEALLRKTGEKPQALYFEGVHGLKQVFSYKQAEMKGKEVVGFWATTNPETMRLFNGFKERNDSWKRQGIRMRGFAPDHEFLSGFRETDAEYGRTIRTLPLSKYSSEIAVEIGEDYVIFQDFVHLQALVIDNPQITKTMREIFELMWEQNP